MLMPRQAILVQPQMARSLVSKEQRQKTAASKLKQEKYYCRPSVSDNSACGAQQQISKIIPGEQIRWHKMLNLALLAQKGVGVTQGSKIGLMFLLA